jgi:exopolysaccharide production protein ExoZ
MGDSAPMPAKNRRIESLLLLRCAAAALVVLYHTDLQLWRLSNAAHIQSSGFGAAGTDLLFVISGFTMVYISHGKRPRFGDFMFRRVARIAPLYWLFTICMVVAFMFSPTLFNNTTFEIKHFIASLAFVPATHPVLGIQRPFLVPGWALNIIAFFYLVFGLFLFLPSTRRIVAVGLVLSALVVLRWLFLGASPLLDFYGAPVVLDFVLGMVVAWIYLERPSIGIATVGLVLTLSVAVFAAGVIRGVGGGEERVLYWGLADTGILLSVLFIEREWGWWNPNIIATLGDASFATYLSNLFTLALVTKAIQVTGLFPILGKGGTQILLVTSALGVGVLTRAVIERPLHDFVLRHGGEFLRWPRRLLALIQSHLGGRSAEDRIKSERGPRVAEGTAAPLLYSPALKAISERAARSPDDAGRSVRQPS